MNLSNIQTILLNTIQKEIRRRVLLVIMIITVLVILGLNQFIGEIAATFSRNGETVDVGSAKYPVLIFVITAWNALLTVIMASDTIRSDFELGVMASILSRPITRLEYFLGRYLGLLSVILFYYLVGYILSFADLHSRLPGTDLALQFFLALCVYSLNIMVYILWGFLASLFIPKLYAATLVLLGVYTQQLINNYFLEGPGENLVDPSRIFRTIGYLIHMIFPRPGFINQVADLVFKGRGMPEDLWLQIAHFGVTYSLLFALTFYLFNRREITGRDG